MTVYIDDMYRYAIGQFKGMKMSHMISDDEDELHVMAARLGLRRAWHQGDHYDVPLDAREKAVRLGAIEITYRQASAMRRRQVIEGACGDPAEAVAWLRGWFTTQKQSLSAAPDRP
jgi:hypothetical protein